MNQPMKGPMDVAVTGEPLVTAIVPRTFILTLPNGTPIRVPGGIHEMPEAIANHFYSKANGVSIYASPKATEPVADEVRAEAATAKADAKRPTLTAKK